jgi:hypothetical protein
MAAVDEINERHAAAIHFGKMILEVQQVLLAAVCTSIFSVLNLFRWLFDRFSKHLRIYHLALAQIPTPRQKRGPLDEQ